MSLRKIGFFLVLAGALASGTLFAASVLYTGFHSWVAALPEAQVKLLPPIFAVINVMLIGLGALLRRHSNSPVNEL